MRAVRFTKAEAEYLMACLEDLNPSEGSSPKGFRTFCSAKAKLKAAMEPAPANVNVGPIEAALVASSRGRVVAMAPGGYARASKQATAVGATVEDAQVVGGWLARQTWWKQGPTTILTVLTRWPEWLAKARATEPPPSLKAGLDANAGQGAGTAGEGTSTGRSARGFR